MNALIVLAALMVFGGALFMAPAEAPGALALGIAATLPALLLLARTDTDRIFLIRVLILGLLIRIVVGTVIFAGGFEEFFGGDALTYSLFGKSLAASWHGDKYHLEVYQNFVASGASAWGMLYIVAAVYEILGENLFAIQLLNAAIGSSTAIVVYYTAQILFNNRRVSRLSALLVAFFPSLVLWSSQALKDGLIVLVLALAIFSTLKLMEKVSAFYSVLLTSCLLSLLTLRFYVFYMMVAAVVGSFVLGMKGGDMQSFMRKFAVIVVLGIAFTWFGVVRYAGSQIDKYANLQMVQNSRMDQATSAESGFGKDVDIQTTEGALQIIPLGLMYLLFAPFPWQLASLRQSIALPEMLVWWVSFPLLVLGLWYAIKHRLREVSPIVMFTTMLTLVYSIFQGNVGTAYRQRSQLLVFYFIFVAVGAVMVKERREDKDREVQKANKDLADLQAARVLARRRPSDLQGSQPAVGPS
jgi:hypothetical protein